MNFSSVYNIWSISFILQMAIVIKEKKRYCQITVFTRKWYLYRIIYCNVKVKECDYKSCVFSDRWRISLVGRQLDRPRIWNINGTRERWGTCRLSPRPVEYACMCLCTYILRFLVSNERPNVDNYVSFI